MGFELAFVGRHDRRGNCLSMGCYQEVVAADRLSGSFQCCADHAVGGISGDVER
jgi:hypothetical protein